MEDLIGQPGLPGPAGPPGTPVGSSKNEDTKFRYFWAAFCNTFQGSFKKTVLTILSSQYELDVREMDTVPRELTLKWICLPPFSLGILFKRSPSFKRIQILGRQLPISDSCLPL